MKMDLKIRKFKIADLKELLEIEKFSFPKSPYSETTFLEWYGIAKDGFFVVEVGGKIVGYIIGFAGSEVGTLVSMATHPDLRGRGIGTALWHRLLEFFREKNLKRVRLEVRKSNIVAQKFYEKLGFKKICIWRNYYGDEDAFVMEYKMADG